MLYYSLIYPFLTYGIQVWSFTYPTYLKPVTTLQKRVVRIMTFSNPRSLDTHYVWAGVAKALLWDLCKQYRFERSDKWYEHIPKNVEDNENFKFLWSPKSMVWIPREATAVRPLRSEFITGSFRSRTTNLRGGRKHSRPQSPSFLGHVVGKRGNWSVTVSCSGRLQIKPSGSGDENGPEVIFHKIFHRDCFLRMLVHTNLTQQQQYLLFKHVLSGEEALAFCNQCMSLPDFSAQ